MKSAVQIIIDIKTALIALMQTSVRQQYAYLRMLIYFWQKILAYTICYFRFIQMKKNKY